MYQKITLTLPVETLNILRKNVPKGKRSEFIAEIIQDKTMELLLNKTLQKKEALNSIDELRKTLPKTNLENILKSIKKGQKNGFNH